MAAISQIFLMFLTGKRSALFLPRYALSVLTEEKVNNQFLVHEKWARSLTALSLAPLVFHLDQKRWEQFSDGTQIERSTREWAATLTFPDGTPSHCDVVNGTSERKAYLLAPSNFVVHAKEHLRQYRMRLSPPSRREARFRDKVPDLPDIIHIKTAIHSNVSFLEELLEADVWKSPQSLTSNDPNSNQSQRLRAGLDSNKVKKVNKNAWLIPPKVVVQPSGEHQHPLTGTVDLTSGDVGDNSLSTDEHSTASTQSITLASESPFHMRLRELESVAKTNLKALEVTSRTSVNKLLQLEKQIGRLNAIDKKMESVKEDLKLAARQLDDSVESQHGISDGLIALQHNSKTQLKAMGSHLLTTAEM